MRSSSMDTFSAIPAEHQCHLPIFIFPIPSGDRDDGSPDLSTDLIERLSPEETLDYGNTRPEGARWPAAKTEKPSASSVHI
ncbi:unnamed protein product [Lota lota]